MALVLANRVQETTATTGTGTITLAGAVSGYQSFAAIGDGNTTYYTITSGTAWEVGIGTYTAAGTTLARTTILSSSAAGAAITLAGTSTVFATYPSERALAFDSAGNQNILNVNNIDYGYSTTVTAAGTTTLTVASPYYIYFTGTSTQTVVMPVTSTLALGWSYHICNNSTGNITVNSSGGNLIGTILPGTTVHITCINTGVTTAAGWDYGYTDFGTITGTGDVVLSASPTFTGTMAVFNISSTGSISAGAGGTLATSSNGGVSFLGTGTIAIGGVLATNAITVGQSTAAQTLNLATGITATATTKAVNIGTAGASGSTTNIALGSATSGATTALTFNGTMTSSALVDAVGYKGMPPNAQTASYTLALTDMGKIITITTGGVVVPANGTVAFPIGSTVIVYNDSAANQTISITTDTMYLAGSATTGSRTLAQRGLATLVKVGTTTWVASGAGLT